MFASFRIICNYQTSASVLEIYFASVCRTFKTPLILAVLSIYFSLLAPRRSCFVFFFPNFFFSKLQQTPLSVSFKNVLFLCMKQYVQQTAEEYIFSSSEEGGDVPDVVFLCVCGIIRWRDGPFWCSNLSLPETQQVKTFCWVLINLRWQDSYRLPILVCCLWL